MSGDETLNDWDVLARGIWNKLNSAEREKCKTGDLPLWVNGKLVAIAQGDMFLCMAATTLLVGYARGHCCPKKGGLD